MDYIHNINWHGEEEDVEEDPLTPDPRAESGPVSPPAAFTGEPPSFLLGLGLSSKTNSVHPLVVLFDDVAPTSGTSTRHRLGSCHRFTLGDPSDVSPDTHSYPPPAVVPVEARSPRPAGVPLRPE